MKIEKSGRLKVLKMNDILNAKTKLKLHETESKIKDLKIIDFEQRAMDVQLYRVTKQTQEIIMQKNIKKDEDIKKRLDNQIKALDDNTKKRINDITSKLKKMQRDIKEKSSENDELERKARVLKQNVEARQQIIDLKSAAANDGGNDPSIKFKEIANQRKMMDVIKQQEEEIMFLQDELDRLRARTFPSFAHLQNKAEFPDQR
jgi:septal ring factor EnvC (AmiA/AmiB activator)